MRVTFWLVQDSGVQGPVYTTEIPDQCPWPDLRKKARTWANGQIGHPWDSLWVWFPNGENEPYDVYREKSPGVPV